MPITEFQREVLMLLKQHRNPDSYVAGGTAIHRKDSSLRRSYDIDFFHDTDQAVTVSAKLDRELLNQRGYRIETLIEQPSFVRSVISRKSDSLKLEWVRDTAFRFFPVTEDPELGYRLDDVDLAVNKCLALANRNEVRDIIDLIQLDNEVLSLSAACWAACGKDPGFTPQLIIDCIKRHSIIRPEQLAAESLTKSWSPAELKQEWLELLDAAEIQIESFPVRDIGCVYLDSTGKPCRFPDPAKLAGKLRHYGSIGGSWPRVVAD